MCGVWGNRPASDTEGDRVRKTTRRLLAATAVLAAGCTVAVTQASAGGRAQLAAGLRLASAESGSTALPAGRSPATGDRTLPAARLATGNRAQSAADGAGALRVSLGGRSYDLSPAALRRLGKHPAQQAGTTITHTLTVTGTNMQGKPDNGDVILVFNVDNGNLNSLYTNAQVFASGTATFQLPDGHYCAIAGYVKATANPLWPAAVHVDVLPQFTIAGDTTVHTDARAATSKVTMLTPRPATAQSSDESVFRGSATGPPSQAFISVLGGNAWVNPTKTKPTVGTLVSYAGQELASPRNAGGVPYRYELSYVNRPGLIPPQRYRVRPSSLATINDVFYTAVPVTADWNTFGTAINQFPPAAGYINPLPGALGVPGRQVRYVGGNAPATTWGGYEQVMNAAGGFLGTGYEQMHVIRPGARLTDSWNQYPLHPGPTVNLDPGSVYDGSLPSASREGNALTVSVTPFDDNYPGHDASGVVGITGATTSGTFKISQGGKPVASGSVPIGPAGTGAFTTKATLAAKPGLVSFELDMKQIGASFPLSNASRTVWTWRSVSQSGGRLPMGWYCNDATRSVHCRVEPMMTLRYHVQGMSLTGSTRPGRQVVNVTAGHIQLAKAGAITGLRMRVSLDGGKTWHAAGVRRTAAGNYQVVFYAAPGSYVTLRTVATDAFGGSITETINRGYHVAH